MAIELIPFSYKGQKILAAVDADTGQTVRHFTEFTIWAALAKSIRAEARTRGQHSASLTIREYAYRLKRWFDFISDWNEVAGEDEKITWQTAQKKHMDCLYLKLAEGPNPIATRTRNGMRLIWEMFYDIFCPFMGYSHLMTGLSEVITQDSRSFMYGDDTHFASVTGRKATRRKSLGMEPEEEDNTFRVLSPDDFRLLLGGFDDDVFSCLTYLMYSTGLRIGGVLQVPYPDTDKNNPYITSPILIRRDYGITENYFEFKYIKKGHEQLNDFAKCDVPIYAWEGIWDVYNSLQEDRLPLWRKLMIRETGDSAYKKLYPKSFWLNKEGKEVVATDVWQAYRDACKEIREKYKPFFPDVVPQMLRHTYATLMVLNISKKDDLILDPENKVTVQEIHQYLQEQLGHKWRSTTRKYIRTALRAVKRRWIPEVSIYGDLSTKNTGQGTAFDRTIDFEGFMKSLKNELSTS